MDKLIYTAMTGATQAFEQLATTSQNLANTNTTGFRAQIDSFQAIPVQGNASLNTRTQVSNATVGADLKMGALSQTGRDLDMAMQGPGWIAVKADDGSEAYTRNGAMEVSSTGILINQSGNQIVGEGGPITVPPDSKLILGRDGTLSTIVPGTVPAVVNQLGRIKLVNPPESNIERGPDGLFRTKQGGAAPADPNLHIVSGYLEGSNVNMIDSMVNMINMGRSFETHINMIKKADDNAAKASQIMNLNA
jgi:flagellar basal-body rod protein FlgF